jgi:hypothetical protein
MKEKNDGDEVIKRIIIGKRIKKGFKDVVVTKAQQETLTGYNRYLEVQGRVLGTRKEYIRRMVEFTPYTKGKPFEEVVREDLSNFFMLNVRQNRQPNSATIPSCIGFTAGWVAGRTMTKRDI